MTKEVKVYCTVHGAMMADDCVECQGDDFGGTDADPGEEIDNPTEEQVKSIKDRIFGTKD